MGDATGDIIITDKTLTGTVKARFISEHGTTVEQVLGAIGHGVLWKDGTVPFVNPSVVVVPGTYVWKEKPPNTSPMAGAIPQQTIAKLRNSVCLFVEAEEALGCGFAISDAKVYSAVARLWKDEDEDKWLAAEGTEVQCFYGKLESNNRYTLKITKLDKRLLLRP